MCLGQLAGLLSQRLDSDWRELLPGMMAQIGIQAGLDEVETAAPRFYLTGAGEAPAADPRHPGGGARAQHQHGPRVGQAHRAERIVVVLAVLAADADTGGEHAGHRVAGVDARAGDQHQRQIVAYRR